jgi:hypothetical protein
VTVCNPMTSQERTRLAQRLHKRAKDPNVSPYERGVALRHCCNLMRINMAVAEREMSRNPDPVATHDLDHIVRKYR